jgi:transcriptional regulator with XRE-family HTH domain
MFNGKIIKQLLERNNQTYDDLSSAIYGPTGGNVSYLINRKSIRTDMLERLANFFDVSTDVFFDRASSGQNHIVGNNNNVGNISINECKSLKLENKLLKQNLADKERLIEAKENEINYLKKMNEMFLKNKNSGQSSDDN